MQMQMTISEAVGEKFTHGNMCTSNSSVRYFFNFNTGQEVDFNVSKADGNIRIQELNEDRNVSDRLRYSFATMATFATQPAPR